MKTLLKNYGESRWYPQPVSKYKGAIIFNGSDSALLKSNFAYSMQYIEYLEKQIKELKLSNVLLTMLYKSYIVTGMGIIEAIFTDVLSATGNWNMTTWREFSSMTTNSKKLEDKETRAEIHLFEKSSEYKMRMDLDSMIKKVESKKLLTINHNTFPALKKLRELRNRVHLQVGENNYDHDYNNFGYEEIMMMRRILYIILTAPEVCNNANTFEFLSNVLFEKE